MLVASRVPASGSESLRVVFFFVFSHQVFLHTISFGHAPCTQLVFPAHSTFLPIALPSPLSPSRTHFVFSDLVPHSSCTSCSRRPTSGSTATTCTPSRTSPPPSSSSTAPAANDCTPRLSPRTHSHTGTRGEVCHNDAPTCWKTKLRLADNTKRLRDLCFGRWLRFSWLRCCVFLFLPWHLVCVRVRACLFAFPPHLVYVDL